MAGEVFDAHVQYIITWGLLDNRVVVYCPDMNSAVNLHNLLLKSEAPNIKFIDFKGKSFV